MSAVSRVPSGTWAQATSPPSGAGTKRHIRRLLVSAIEIEFLLSTCSLSPRPHESRLNSTMVPSDDGLKPAKPKLAPLRK